MKPKKKAKRGPTLCKDVWGLCDGSRLHVDLNSIGQPVGKNAIKLSSFLGSLARNGSYAPLNYEDWRLVPEQLKGNLWKMVEVENFISTSSSLDT